MSAAGKPGVSKEKEKKSFTRIKLLRQLFFFVFQHAIKYVRYVNKIKRLLLFQVFASSGSDCRFTFMSVV